MSQPAGSAATSSVRSGPVPGGYGTPLHLASGIYWLASPGQIRFISESLDREMVWSLSSFNMILPRRLGVVTSFDTTVKRHTQQAFNFEAQP